MVTAAGSAAPIRVVSLRSRSTQAICVPWAGRKDAPTTAGRIAAPVAGERPSAIPRGMFANVALGWRVVMAATVNTVTQISCDRSTPNSLRLDIMRGVQLVVDP